MGIAAIFPGQGAQLVGMGRDVAEQFAVAAEVYAQADRILGLPLSTLCWEGPAERLEATDIQQPAIFVTSVAIFRAAQKADLLPHFAAMGGLSLGEYTALHLAGALSFEDALRLVHRRGTLMQQAARGARGGMVSLIGISPEQAERLCEAVRAQGQVQPANFNCPGQIVISGDAGACNAACEAAAQFGGKAVPLKVAGAFHSAHMRPAAEQFRVDLAASHFAAPKLPVVANVDAGYHGPPDQIRDSLYRQIFSPVRWQECVERLIADGCREFWEIGPNRVLTGMMRKIDRSAKAINLSKAADLTQTAQAPQEASA